MIAWTSLLALYCINDEFSSSPFSEEGTICMVLATMEQFENGPYE
jgi:hypothetical protein